MTPKALCRSAIMLSVTTICFAATAHAQQYVYGSNASSGQQAPTNYPAPSNNYVSAAGSSRYQNPYQVPAATATSYQQVSVPGNSYQDATYPAIATAPPAVSSEPVSVPSPTPAPAPVLAAESQPSPQSQYQPTQVASSIQQLPSYTYDPNLDPRQLPVYKPPTTEQMQTAGGRPIYHPYMGLETRSGLELGGQFFYYSYEEPSLSVSETGELVEFLASGTAKLGDGIFGTAEASYMLGDADYTGSGTLAGTGVDSWEFRGLIGKDFMVLPEYSLSPYVGIGYRTLFNDARGTSSTGAPGYRRYNELFYLPIGVYPRTHIDTNSRLSGMLEFDYVVHGLQTSYLSDVNRGDPNISNSQTSGYGIRGNIMYETKTWSFGPVFTYWNIDQSKSNTTIDNSPITCAGVGGPPCILSGYEPANNTFEAGVEFKYHFF